MKSIKTLLVVAVGIAWGASYGQEADLGASFSRVWFARGKQEGTNISTTEPLVGIEIKVSQLALAIHEQYKKDAPKVSDVSKKLLALFAEDDESALKGLFRIQRTDYKPQYSTPIKPFLSEDKKTIILVLPSSKGTEDDESLSNSINASYELFFELAYFVGPKSLPNLSGETVKHKDKLTFTGRGSVTGSTNFAQQDTKLIDTGNPAAKSQRTAFAIGFKGVANPLQGAIFRKERSYYDFKIDGVLTEKTNDQQSRISLSFEGVTNVWGMPGTVSTRTFRYDTSQHARQQSLLYDIGWKWGDNRADGVGFIPSSDAEGTFTMNFGVQVGGIFFKRITGVTDPVKMRKWLVRPRVTVACNDFLKGQGGLLALSGKATLYAVSKDLGGADTFNGYAEEFDLTAKFGPDNQQITFSVSGGRNRSQDFAKVSPTYSFGLAYKF